MIRSKLFQDIPEKTLQKVVHEILSEPSTVRQTVSGKRIQILSPGMQNVHEGPDFVEIAILLDGIVIVGDAEFHRKSTEWNKHSHDSDKNYNSVILHIVLENDYNFPELKFETLMINADEIRYKLARADENDRETPDISSLEDLQHYALLRLLRKTSEAQKLLNNNGLIKALEMVTEEYILKYYGRRKRPVYTIDNLRTILSSLKESQAYRFLEELKSGSDKFIPDRIHSLIKNKISSEGAHLRREIVLNCILPLALCLANDDARISLFLWFWSTPSLHQYGILSRRFKGMPQNFLWQQQGMLEYMREHGRRPNVVSDAVKNYGFAEVLSFYRLGRAPFNQIGQDFENE